MSLSFITNCTFYSISLTFLCVKMQRSFFLILCVYCLQGPAHILHSLNDPVNVKNKCKQMFSICLHWNKHIHHHCLYWLILIWLRIIVDVIEFSHWSFIFWLSGYKMLHIIDKNTKKRFRLDE